MDNAVLGDVESPVLRSFLIDKPHFESTQGLISKFLQNLYFLESLNTHLYQYLMIRDQTMEKSFLSFKLHTPIYLSLSGGCRNRVTVFQSIFFVTLLLNACYTNVNYFEGSSRQKERGLGALAGTNARTAFPIFQWVESNHVIT